MSSYILNMGGTAGSTAKNTVDVFKVTGSSVKVVTGHSLTLSQGRRNLASAVCGEYILAMGGYDGLHYYNNVDVFKATENGVEAVPDHGLSLSQARYSLAAAACGQYILAMGGYTADSVNTIDLFKVTENGVEHILDHGLTLSVKRSSAVAAASGEYILAMGGMGANYSNVVDLFRVTENGVEHITDHSLSLSVGRRYLAAAAAGNYILAMGGYNGTDHLNTVDVFKVTENGVEKVTDHGLVLSVGRDYLAAASCGNYILALGGRIGTTTFSDAVDVFKVTENGVEKVTDHGLALSVGRGQLTAAAAGNFILGMGGWNGTYSYRTIDVFQVFN